MIAELTGDIQAVGASCKNAAAVFVKEINEAAGVELGGKKYKFSLLWKTAQVKQGWLLLLPGS